VGSNPPLPARQRGPTPRTILGGQQIEADENYFISYVTADQVHDIILSLTPITRQWLHERFLAMYTQDYLGPHDEDDFTYTWATFTDIRTFFHQVAKTNRAVIFTVD
jgi:hypothetical protein